MESNIIAEENIHFHAATNTCPPALNSDKVDWRITSIQYCISEYRGGLEKGDSDNEVIDVATDDDEEESLLQVTPREGLRMLDELFFVTGICEEDRKALFSIKERMETLSIAYKKQSILVYIIKYFLK